jgi:hypothetical protein
MRPAWLAMLALLLSAATMAKDSELQGIKVWQQPTYTLYSHDESMARVLADAAGGVTASLVPFSVFGED